VTVPLLRQMLQEAPLTGAEPERQAALFAEFQPE
jgi:hypothetical protein